MSNCSCCSFDVGTILQCATIGTQDANVSYAPILAR
jgi:hypothetical protein